MQIKKIYLALFALLAASLFYSCYYDKADILYPGAGAGCDTSVVSYNQKVTPLLSQQCYGCHGTVAPGGGIVLGNYNADRAAAATGRLYGAINHANGFSPMPKGVAILSPCQITKIKKWIDAGSPNN